jgi:hypothetical protein
LFEWKLYLSSKNMEMGEEMRKKEDREREQSSMKHEGYI